MKTSTPLKWRSPETGDPPAGPEQLGFVVADAQASFLELADNYREVARTPVITAAGAVVATWILGSTAGFPYFASAAVLTTEAVPAAAIGLRAADHAVANLRTLAKIKMQVYVGATSPGSTVITVGLYPLSIAEGKWVIGAVTTGLVVASSSLAVNTIKRFDGSDIEIPADGAYALGMAVSGATVPAGIQVSAQLAIRNLT